MLCHVREVDLRDTELAMGDDDGWLAVVLCNRLPQPGTRYTACLVNVEGAIADALPVDPPVAEEYLRRGAVVDLEPGDVAAAGHRQRGRDADGHPHRRPRGADRADRAGGPRSGGGGRDGPGRRRRVRGVRGGPAGGLHRRGLGGSSGAAGRRRRGPAAPRAAGTRRHRGRGRRAGAVAPGGAHGAVPGADQLVVHLHRRRRLPDPRDDGHSRLLGHVVDPDAPPEDPDGDPLPPAPGPPPSPPSRRRAVRCRWWRPPGTSRPRTARGAARTPPPGSAARSCRTRSPARWPARTAGTRWRTTATSLRRVTPDGREDLTYAAAYEIGRLLALSQPSVVAALNRWRHERFSAALTVAVANGVVDRAPSLLQAALATPDPLRDRVIAVEGSPGPPTGDDPRRLEGAGRRFARGLLAALGAAPADLADVVPAAPRGSASDDVAAFGEGRDARLAAGLGIEARRRGRRHHGRAAADGPGAGGRPRPRHRPGRGAGGAGGPGRPAGRRGQRAAADGGRAMTEAGLSSGRRLLTAVDGEVTKALLGLIDQAGAAGERGRARPGPAPGAARPAAVVGPAAAARAGAVQPPRRGRLAAARGVDPVLPPRPRLDRRAGRGRARRRHGDDVRPGRAGAGLPGGARRGRRGRAAGAPAGLGARRRRAERPGRPGHRVPAALAAGLRLAGAARAGVREGQPAGAAGRGGRRRRRRGRRPAGAVDPAAHGAAGARRAAGADRRLPAGRAPGGAPRRRPVRHRLVAGRRRGLAASIEPAGRADGAAARAAGAGEGAVPPRRAGVVHVAEPGPPHRRER
nr:hypothetical protein [Angustibacter aerolatus]